MGGAKGPGGVITISAVGRRVSSTVAPMPSCEPTVGILRLAPRGRGIQPLVALQAAARALMKSVQFS